MSNGNIAHESADDRAAILREVAQALRGYQNALDGFEEAISEHLGLNRTDLRCIDLLELNDSMTAGHLAQAAGLTSGAVTFVLDRLEAAGFARRRRDEVDRRRVLIELIPAARERVWKLHEPLVMELRLHSRRFSLGELAVIRDFFSLARAGYERHAPLVRSMEKAP